MLWKRARAPLVAAGTLLFWLLAAGWLSAPLLELAQRDQPPVANTTFAARTAIVLLGGGTEYDDNGKLIPKRDVFARIEASAGLYTACKRAGAACSVIVSGGNPQRHEAAEADTYLPYLLKKRIPRADVVLESRSRTTYENARYVSAIVQRGHYDSLIVVTSAYQMPRALLDFDCFGMTPQPVVSNVRHVQRGLLPRYENLRDAELALHELIGIAQFYVYRAIGWF